MSASCSLALSYRDRDVSPTYTPFPSFRQFSFPSFPTGLQISHLFSYKRFLFLQSSLFSSPWLQGTQSCLVQSDGPHGFVLGSNIPNGLPADSTILTLYPVAFPRSISDSCSLLASSPPAVLSRNITLLMGAKGPLPLFSFLPSGMLISPSFFLILLFAFLFNAFSTLFNPPRVMDPLFVPLFFFLIFPAFLSFAFTWVSWSGTSCSCCSTSSTWMEEASTWMEEASTWMDVCGGGSTSAFPLYQEVFDLCFAILLFLEFQPAAI